MDRRDNMNAVDREVLVAVTKAFLSERLHNGQNHCTRKCLFHARKANITYLRNNLKKLGIDPKRLDAILPLLSS